ncbi:MAG: hypothetical protein WC587_03790 [Candidatus Paceibacterota bacterium]
MNFEKFGTIPEKSPEYRKREDSWEKMEKSFNEPVEGKFDDSEDVVNEGNIDKNIKELVVGLNMIGAETHLSCEGHYKGVSRCTAKGHIDSYGRWNMEEVENPPLEGKWNNPYVGFHIDIYPLFARTEKERQKRRKKEHKIIASIQALIDEYYSEREKLPEIRVRINKKETRYTNYEIIASDTEGIEAVSGTEDYEDLKQRAMERIENERQEIVDFGKFIKKKYLETGFHLKTNHLRS